MLKKYTLLILGLSCATNSALKSENEYPRIQYPDLRVSNEILNCILLGEELSLQSEIECIPLPDGYTDYVNQYINNRSGDVKVKVGLSKAVTFREDGKPSSSTIEAILNNSTWTTDIISDSYTKCYITYAKLNSSKGKFLQMFKCDSAFPEKLFEDAKKKADSIKKSNTKKLL